MTGSPTPRPKGPTPSWFWVLISVSPAGALVMGLMDSSDWRVIFGLAWFSFLPAVIALDREQARRRRDP